MFRMNFSMANVRDRVAIVVRGLAVLFARRDGVKRVSSEELADVTFRDRKLLGDLLRNGWPRSVSKLYPGAQVVLIYVRSTIANDCTVIRRIDWVRLRRRNDESEES